MANTLTTNMSLQKPIDEHIISNDFNNLQAAHSANMDILEAMLTGVTTFAGTNASIINTSGARFTKIYACSAGSISTITGMVANVPFTLMIMSSGASLALVDGGVKALSANWIPSTIYSNLTLVWDGTNYIELARTAA
jgi:hypothetical protein